MASRLLPENQLIIWAKAISIIQRCTAQKSQGNVKTNSRYCLGLGLEQSCTQLVKKCVSWSLPLPWTIRPACCLFAFVIILPPANSLTASRLCSKLRLTIALALRNWNPLSWILPFQGYALPCDLLDPCAIAYAASLRFKPTCKNLRHESCVQKCMQNHTMSECMYKHDTVL